MKSAEHERALDDLLEARNEIDRLKAEVAEYENTLPWLKIISANKEIARLEAEVEEWRSRSRIGTEKAQALSVPVQQQRLIQDAIEEIRARED